MNHIQFFANVIIAVRGMKQEYKRILLQLLKHHKASPSPEYLEHVVKSTVLYTSCFQNVHIDGVVLGLGTIEKGDIKTHKETLDEAYNKGINV